MIANDCPVPPEVDIVRSFLREFYFAEEWEDQGTIRALQAQAENRRYRWRIANAFDRILGEQLPAGLLQELVATSANRDVLTDVEAREFLERVYESNAFDVAIDFDEFQQDQQ